MNTINIKRNPLIILNKDFKTIQIKVMFPFHTKNEDTAFNKLLPGMINYLNNKYISEEDMVIEKQKLFILNASCNCTIIGDMGVFIYSFEIPDKTSIKQDLLEEQFLFFNNFIYNPRVINNKFLDDELEREKMLLNMGIDNTFKNINAYHSMRIREEVDTLELLSYNLIKHRDLIDKVHTNNLYDYYLEKIYNNTPAIYVLGNCNKTEINKLCNKYLYRKKFNNYSISFNLYNFLIPRNEINIKTDKTIFKDSIISLVYKVKDIKYDDIFLLKTIRNILDSSTSRILYKKLRDENDLVYSCYSTTYPHFGLLEISAYINKNNKDIVEGKIYEVMNELKNESVLKDALDNIKNLQRLNTIKKLDNKNLILSDIINKDLDIDYTQEEYYEKLCNVTIEELLLFIDRLVLDTVYFIKEGEDE